MLLRSETRVTFSPLRRTGKPGTLDTVMLALAIWRQRKVLSELDDRMLSDVGLNSVSAKKEAERPIWDIPAHWKR